MTVIKMMTNSGQYCISLMILYNGSFVIVAVVKGQLDFLTENSKLVVCLVYG